VYSTYVVVSFGFAVNPWAASWSPPMRHGWSWIPGYYSEFGYWVPGHWTPLRSTVPYYETDYVYVRGFWQQDLYIEGYYRTEARTDGDWEWVDGYYLEDGTWIPGHWIPAAPGPEGYFWEPGFFDGETWVEGFWRPEYRAGYVWVSSWYDSDGVFNSGYWEPTVANAGYVWIPGWFDGNQWVEGYWVDEGEYMKADLGDWEPEEGWHDGWDPETGEVYGLEEHADVPSEPMPVPLAMPVFIEEEDL
jgi:hypothetical protein